jgi:predicted dehydrogenase
MHRRDFLSGTAAAALASQLAAQEKTNVSPNDKIAVCVMGVRGRGGSLLSTFASLPDVEVRYVCDIDETVLQQRIAGLAKSTAHKPQAIKDYRAALDDKSLDAIVNGGPDHWHALPTIHACQAKKDVYVEKPDGHNIVEGQTMVAAMKKHERVVQMGTQMRSAPHLLAAMEYLQTGALGKVRFAKAWESGRQGAITAVPDGDPPKGVDYDRWLGGAPLRKFNARRFHGNWRWFFDYGTGDLGNDGVHRLDVARWALETALAAKQQTLPAVPTRVSALGGKYYFDDVQEWPDTLQVTFDYEGLALLNYEMRIWTGYPLYDEPEGSLVYGDAGSMILGNTRWRAFDAKGKLIKEQAGNYDDGSHARNFLDCMRTRAKPAADLATVGHPSSLLCHLGNAAWRARRTLRFDPATYRFLDDEDANQYLTRKEYRKPYELPGLDEV